MRTERIPGCHWYGTDRKTGFSKALRIGLIAPNAVRYHNPSRLPTGYFARYFATIISSSANADFIKVDSFGKLNAH